MPFVFAIDTKVTGRFHDIPGACQSLLLRVGSESIPTSCRSLLCRILARPV